MGIKYGTLRIILCGIFVLELLVITQADVPAPLPTYSADQYEYHYDPHSGISGWEIRKGWVDEQGKKFDKKEYFKDELDATEANWQWETEWYNPDPNIYFVIPMVFRAEGFGYGTDRFPMYRGIEMFPQQATFFQIEPFNESITYPENETGADYSYHIWMQPNPGGLPFRHDCSICELDEVQIGMLQDNGPSQGWIPMTEEEVMSVPHVEVIIRRAPPMSRQVPALSRTGSIAMVLVLLMAGSIGVVWLRRSMA